MTETKKEPKEIEYEGKLFDLYAYNEHKTPFDLYVLKSYPSAISFDFEGKFVEILTSKFPTGEFGCGYNMSITIMRGPDDAKGKCYASGKGGNRSFKSEFEAQKYMIEYVLRCCLITNPWHSGEIKEKLNNYINPKTLFNNDNSI